VDLGTDVLPALGLGAEQPEPGLMHQPPRPRQAPLLDGSVMRRSYLFLGVLEATASMGAYLLVWHRAGVSLPQLQALAPQLLSHSAPAALQLLQRQASAAAFSTIVFSQVGVLLACRSEWRCAWRSLLEPNPMLWFGIVSELLLLGALVLIPALGSVVAMAPFPAPWLGWMLLAPLLIVLADDQRKRCISRRVIHGTPTQAAHHG
jgi:magnesium-transporting ATPase (P-type)